MASEGEGAGATPTLTSPPIFEAQQRPESVELLKAQAVAYSQAKQARNQRLILVVAVSVATAFIALAVSAPAARIAVSVVGAVLSFAAEYLAKRRLAARVNTAVAIQEKFDTTIFQLGWNQHQGLSHPIPAEVATLASLYSGHRFDKPWYPDPGHVHRPLDVLLCQQSNAAWATPTHRRWAVAVSGVSAALVLVPLGLAVSPIVSLRDYLTIGLLPWTSLLVWLFNEANDHVLTARAKAAALQDVLATWSRCLTQPGGESDCREIQNEIANSRKRNAITPDWFDQKNRERNEKAMRAAAQAMRAEAAVHGKSGYDNDGDHDS